MMVLAVGERTLPRYAHPCAPKTYTQAQLLACLIVKAFWSVDYRTAAIWLEDNPTLRDDLALKKTPHFTTLHKAHRRLLRFDLVRSLLGSSARQALGRRGVIARRRRLQRVRIRTHQPVLRQPPRSRTTQKQG